MKEYITYRQITAIIFFAALLTQTFSRLFVVADYYTNTAKYAQNCENKAKPKMRCNGKCQMMKKLQQEEKKDQENPDRKADNKNEIVLSSKSFAPTLPKFSSIEIITKPQYPNIANSYTYNSTNSIFHPPKV